jgi:hypothetical protein
MRTINRIGAFSILTIIVGVCMSACIAQGEPAAESPDEATVGEAKQESSTDTTSTRSEAADREASPDAVQCVDGICESLALCHGDGFHVVGPCGIPVDTVCCVIE